MKQSTSIKVYHDACNKLPAWINAKKASCIPEVALKLNVENEKKLKMNK